MLSKLKGMESVDQRYIEYGMKMGAFRLNRIGSAVVVMVSVDGPIRGDPGIAKTYQQPTTQTVMIKKRGTGRWCR